MKISALALSTAHLGGTSTSYATDVNVSDKKTVITPKTTKDDEKETYLRSLQSSGMSIPIKEAGSEEAEPNFGSIGSWGGLWWDKYHPTTAATGPATTSATGPATTRDPGPSGPFCTEFEGLYER